jgi:hypothetical protein
VPEERGGKCEEALDHIKNCAAALSEMANANPKPVPICYPVNPLAKICCDVAVRTVPCLFKAVTMHELKLHKNEVHKDARCWFVCPEANCDEGFRFQSLLDEHHTAEHTEDGFSCKLCAASKTSVSGLKFLGGPYLNQAVLDDHVASEHPGEINPALAPEKKREPSHPLPIYGPRKYNAPDPEGIQWGCGAKTCRFLTKSRKELREHREKNHPQAKFRCEICDFVSTSAAVMDLHDSESEKCRSARAELLMGLSMNARATGTSPSSDASSSDSGESESEWEPQVERKRKDRPGTEVDEAEVCEI